MTQHLPQPQRLGIAGLGTIGKALARALDAGQLPGFALEAVTARDPAAAAQWMGEQLSRPVDCVEFEALAERCDWVVECAPSKLLRAIAEPGPAAGGAQCGRFAGRT